MLGNDMSFFDIIELLAIKHFDSLTANIFESGPMPTP